MANKLVKAVLGFLGFVAVTIGGVWVLGIYDWVIERISGPATIVIDFQASHRCVTGRLTDLTRHFDDKSVKLEWGADRLVICDPDVLRTNALDAPGDIARSFPGCLAYRSGSLIMLRASGAVCELPSQNIFICDGDAGGVFPGAVAMGGPATSLPECANATLSKFGFRT